MKKRLSCFLALALCTLTASGEVLFEQKTPQRLTGLTRIATWEPGIPAAKSGSVRITFLAREFEPAPGTKKGGHWGLAFTNRRGENGYVFASDRGLHLVLNSALGKPICGDNVKGHTPTVKVAYGTDGATNGWTRVTIESGPDTFQARLDDEICRSERISLLPLAKSSFRAYNRDVEIRDLRVETFEPAPIKKIAAPVIDIAGPVTPRDINCTNPVSSAVGGVMFWAKFHPGTDCVRFVGADGKTKARFYCFGDFRIQADIAIAGTDRPLVYKRRLLEESTRAHDDFHYAFTWREDGQARFFLNGIPFDVGLGGDDYKMPLTGNALDGVVKIVVGDARHPAAQTVSDLRVYHRTLANREVMDAYRARVPVDCVFQDSVLTADRPDTLRLSLAPGGTYRLPMPIEDYPTVTGRIAVTTCMESIVTARNAAGHTYHTYTPVAGGTAAFSDVTVTNKTDLSLPPVTLPRGNYRLLVTLTAPGQAPALRTMLFSALPDVTLPAEKPSLEKWRKSGLVWHRAFRQAGDMPYSQGTPTAGTLSGTDGYLECGAQGGLSGDRMACIVDFPTNALGHPCLLEFTWPDDKPRVMGLYMYLDSSKVSHHRDRLMGGIVAGEFVKTTGRMQTTEYLFFPSSTNHLFEARTMVTGRPAAIAALKVWRLEEPLPVLAIRRPEGLPARRLGHVDEDQTFDFLLNDQYAHGMDEKMAELFRYFAYTGQSAFDYNIWRYNASFGANELHWAITGFAGGQGQLPYMFRQFDRAGVSLAGGMFLFGEPHIARRDETDFKSGGEDYLWLDDEGRNARGSFERDGTANMAHPAVRKMLQAYCEDLLVQSATRGLKAVKIYSGMLGKWPDLKTGYDDWTWRRFHATTGLTPPAGMPAKAVTARDFHARYTYLTNTNTPAIRTRWLHWRADTVTRYFQELVDFIRARAPQLEIRLMLPAGTVSDYEEHGLDVRQLATIRGILPGYERSYTSYWWDLFHPQKRNPEKFTGLYDRTCSPVLKAIATQAGSARVCCSDANYFETFRGSPCNARFKSYFQSADVKPWGRAFLREPAFMVAAFDCFDCQIGGQPLGTLGREDETREFARAFCALPARHFNLVPGSRLTSVVARSCTTARGTYFYLVNLTDEDRTVTLSNRKDNPPQGSIDLSTGEGIRSWRFTLKPFELRSFRVPNEAGEFLGLAVTKTNAR